MAKSKAEDLKVLIDGWLAEKPTRTIRILADRSCVQYNTVRRVHQCEVEPECYTAMSLLMIVAKRPQALAYMREHFPNAASFFGRFAESEKTAYLPSVSQHSKDMQALLILHLAYGRQATKANIFKLFGETAMLKVDALVNQGTLIWSDDEDSLLPADGKEFFLYQDKDAVADGCQHITELSRAAGPENAPVSMIASVTRDEKEQIKQIIRLTVEEIGAILERSSGGTEFIGISTVFTRILGSEK